MGRRKKFITLTETNKESEDCKTMNLLGNDSQEKSPTNAFQLLMESRHKSIGNNSPGKYTPVSEEECQELLDRREQKAKRYLSLQKMAEAKGSLKNKELEDYRDRSIKKQLTKQAEKFKTMLTQEKPESKNKSNVTNKHSLAAAEIIDDDVTHIIDVRKTLQLCNMFEKSDAEGLSQKLLNKSVTTEDREFLSKLSPSIRKKGNMLNYFPKIEKTIDDTLTNAVELSNPIKVKFKSKISKKRSHKRGNENHKQLPKIQNEIVLTECVEEDNLMKNSNMSECTASSLNQINGTEILNEEKRPKRKTKRPAKYLDETEMSNSDDELYIFTPKKKKKSEKSISSNPPLAEIIVEKVDQDENLSIKQTHEKTKNSISQPQNRSTKRKNDKSINPIKLAPIFISNLNAAEKEARQKFLHSGIPEKFKKQNSQHQSNTSVLEFYPVVHIQQNMCKKLGNLKKNFSFVCEPAVDLNLEFKDSLYKDFLSLNEEVNKIIPLNQIKQEDLLHIIKNSYQKFPVYRTYSLLKGKSKGENKDYSYPDLDNSIEIIDGLPNDFVSIDKLCWVDKYKPTSSKQIIGNFTAIDEIKKWLQSWSERLLKTKRHRDSDSSDFDDFQDSDTDSREALRTSNNVLLICGDVGSGKTSSVYAVAAELAIKVIEVNASSKRTGKIMLQDLQEATRSHKVDRGKNYLDNTKPHKVQEPVKSKLPKKRGRAKKSKDLLKNMEFNKNTENYSSQDGLRTDSSLILIDDADIVFEQDDGFCSAISQLIQSSKRPVILITSSISCQHLQKFIQFSKVIKMNKFLPRMLGTWLDIMCVADTGICFPGLGDGLLDYYKGDIRKTIHSLQFYMVSYKHSAHENSQEIAPDKLNIEDENSCLSWTDEYKSSTLPYTLKNVQQHIKVISLGSNLDPFKVRESIYNTFESMENPETNSGKLNYLSNMLCNISEADRLTNRGNNMFCDKLWYSKQSASLNETESLEYYNRNNDISEDIAKELALLTSKCATKGKSEKLRDSSTSEYCMEREQEKIATRHHTLSSFLNPGVVLDRRALALDYWPSCRTICRLEKNNFNTKRNNRFCHYLKSLNVLCKNDYFDALSKSLNNDKILK